MGPLGGGRGSGGGSDGGSRRFRLLRNAQKKVPGRHLTIGDSKTAATYSPNWWVSTIGDGELNFSVRNGKRWILTAITTVICYLREKNNSENLPVHWINSQFRFRFRNFSAIFPLGKSLGQLVQVS